MPYLFLCKGKLIYWVTHVTEIKPLTVLILTSSVKNENRKIMNTIIIVLFTHRRHFLFFFKVNLQITDLSKDGLCLKLQSNMMKRLWLSIEGSLAWLGGPY